MAETSATGESASFGSPPRIVTLAPFYRSFPIEAVRDMTRGLTVTVIGALPHAIRQSLPDADIRNVIPFPGGRIGSAQRKDDLLQAFAGLVRTDWTLVVDPQAARLLQDGSEPLFILRQLTRRSVVIPLAVDPEHLAITACRHLAQEEVMDFGRWRWIDNEEGWAEIEIWSARARPSAIWSVTPSFCAPAVAAGLVEGTLIATLNGSPASLAIASGQRFSMPLPLRAGRNLLRIQTDVQPASSSSDPRRLSIAVLDPELETAPGRVVPPAGFLGGGHGPMQTATLAFHAAGFEHVGGFVCGTGHGSLRRPLPESRGSPLSRLLSPLESWSCDEPDLADDEIAWLFCGEPMQ